MFGVLVLAAVLYLANLTVSGYANAYYSAAAWAGSEDWLAFFAGSLDPSNFITVDKPPLATMVAALSVRLFGLSPASILVPEALMGVATVAVTIVAVRRSFGAAAGVLAGLVTALMPAAVLMFRYNNPDALLTLLLVSSVAAFLRAQETGRRRYLFAAALLTGLAFETKLLQGLLLVPVFGLGWLALGPGSLRRRLLDLAASAGVMTLAGGWWVAAMSLLPDTVRPYVGGSTDGSALDLTLGYNGLGRIFGRTAGLGVVEAPNRSFSGDPGPLRLFNDEMGGQGAWWLPAALGGAVLGLLGNRATERTDPRRAAWLVWTGYLAVHAAVFSLMAGTIHSYYVVVMAPAIGALAGAGVVTTYRRRDERGWGRLLLGGMVAATGALAALILARTPGFIPPLGPAILLASLVAGTGLAAGPVRLSRRLDPALATLALVAALAGPAAYATATMSTAYWGGIVVAGPAAVKVSVPGGGAVAGSGMPDGMGSPLDEAALAYLVAEQGTARWILAASSSNSSAPIELATGRAVMTIGGFNGHDPVPTLSELQGYIARGELRFVLVGDSLAGGAPGGGSALPGGPLGPGASGPPPGVPRPIGEPPAGPGRARPGGGANEAIAVWVRASCVASDTSPLLYDCAAAAD